MMLSFEDVLSALQIERAREVLEPYWEESMAATPEGTPGFLTEEAVTRAREFVALPTELDGLLVETVTRIAANRALVQLAWHCNRLLYDVREYPGPNMARWPELDAALGEIAGAFYLVIALDVVPRTQAYHRTRGIPEAITRQTMSRFWESTEVYRQHHGGRWGVTLRVLYWQRNYTVGDLYGIGRMEYMVRPFWGRLRAYRHQTSGEVVALAEEGVRFGRQGYVAFGDEEETWESRLCVTEDAVTGNPISPTGVGLPREVTLPLSEWQLALKPGDPVLEMHIPAGGGMTPERCRDSMREALDFFPQYFPERPFVGFGCGSWILNPEIAEFYTPESNMVLWQRELYLFPISSSGRDGLFFVFGEDDVDPRTAPRDTSLRRAILDHLAAGKKLRCGGMFMLSEDLPHYGEQWYRTVSGRALAGAMGGA